MGTDGRLEVRATARAAAPAPVVWALLADARGWQRWTRISRSTLEREGDPAPDGVGAIRSFRTGWITSREEVTGFEPPARLAYRLLSGLAVRDYRAEVTLTPAGDETVIDWVGRFAAKYPGTGWAMRAFLATALRDFARRLARAAGEQRA